MLQDIATLATLVNNLSDPAWITQEQNRIFGVPAGTGELANNESTYNNLQADVVLAQFDLDQAKQELEAYRDPNALTTI